MTNKKIIEITDSEKTLLLAKKLFEFYAHASKDTARFTLRSVYIHAINNRVRIFATDGHRLVDDTYIFLEAPMLLSPMPRALMIVPDFFGSNAEKFFQGAKVSLKNWVFGEDTPGVFCFSDGEQKISFRVDRYIDAPPVDAIIPPESRASDWICVNANYLVELVDSLKISTRKATKKDLKVRIKVKSDAKGIDRKAPIMLETVHPVEGVKQVRVVMPLRD